MRQLRGEKRAAKTFVRAFADHHAHEEEAVFIGAWQDMMRELLTEALGEREERRQAAEADGRRKEMVALWGFGLVQRKDKGEGRFL